MQNLARVGVDIGGTFTDFVVEHRGRQTCLKLLTTPDAPERAVLEGLRQILGNSGVAPPDVGMVVHGTTLATNAVIERRGARVAFLTTEGFRDTLEMAYEHRHDQYDLLVGKPVPLVPRSLRLPITERIAADGTELRPLDVAAVRTAATRLAAEHIEAVAIGFLHAYANPDHEHEAAAILRESLPAIPVSLSSDVSPEIREYERFTTVTANAYVQPLMSGYLGRLEAGLRKIGIGGPLMLMQSNGGLCDVPTAMQYPVRLLESGPAGGAVFAASLARALGIARVLLLDIGGTTAKLCFIEDSKPQTTHGLEVARIDRFKPGSGLPLRLPVVQLCEIGAGGGSIAAVDRIGRLKVGPRSAGSVPGPACYRRGGIDATVTDAHLLLGRLDPDRFADGEIPLDIGAARASVAQALAGPLALEVEDTAVGVVEVVNENMASAAREHAIEAGHGFAGRTLIAIGGAAPLHAGDLAAKLGMSRILVPVAAGVGSAVGFLRAPLSFEKSRSQHQLLSRFSVSGALALVDTLADETAAVLRPSAGDAALTARISAQMRYRGQGHEITVPLDRMAIAGENGTELRRAFEAVYRGLYGRALDGKDVEVLGWSVRTEASMPEACAEVISAQVPRSGGERAWRFIEQHGGAVAARAIDRTALAVGTEVPGPALVVDAGTTIMIPAGFTATVLRDGHLLLEAVADGRAEAAVQA
jgi:N-methylhydantoinase A/oxoprolinase/acetone carboxylase beta subunit